MIRYISNAITDELGRRNFVDSNGVGIGLKEFPDGRPLLWTVVQGSESEPEAVAYDTDVPLHVALDRQPYVFGDVGVVQSEHNDGVELAKIQLISDVRPENPSILPDACDKVLYVVISKADNLYFADLKMSMNDKKKLFGNVDALKAKIHSLRIDMGRVVKGLHELETIVDAMDYGGQLVDKESVGE